MDELTKAIIAAGRELHDKHGWSLGDEPSQTEPKPDDDLVLVLHKHLLPLCDFEAVKRARIAALKAEISALEGE